VLFFILFLIGILVYEVIAFLPESWGYFHFGWWNLVYSVFSDPLLLLILLGYYGISVELNNFKEFEGRKIKGINQLKNVLVYLVYCLHYLKSNYPVKNRIVKHICHLWQLFSYSANGQDS
jgi:hypothetical protein